MMVRGIKKTLVAALTLCLETALVSGTTGSVLASTHDGHAGRHGGGGHFSRTHFGGLHFAGGHFGANHAAGREGTAPTFNRLAVADRFRPIHGLNPHGFNRNAFGDMRTWNNWARDHWGMGWNSWGSGWGYWVGAVFSPFLYGDALSFAFWPDVLYDPFFAYGPDYLLSSIFSPGPIYGVSDKDGYPLFDVYGYPPDAQNYYGYYRWRHHRHHTVSEDDSAASRSPVRNCGGLAPGITSLPIERIEKTIKMTTPQMEMLNQLQAASTKADALLRASCPSEPPLTPVGRLNAVGTRLNAIAQAINILRIPLTRLDESLDDTQREKLAALGGRSKYRHAGVAMSQAPARDLAALCKKPAPGFTLLPVQRIEDIVKPTTQQKPAFEALKRASTTAASNLDASCPSDIPETLAGRLNAVVTRLNALAEAVSIIRPPLAQFYGSLSDEQKARFNIIGGMNDASAPPQDAAHSRL